MALTANNWNNGWTSTGTSTSAYTWTSYSNTSANYPPPKPAPPEPVYYAAPCPVWPQKQHRLSDRPQTQPQPKQPRCNRCGKPLWGVHLIPEEQHPLDD